ncbi:MAG: hypothetical protein DMF79_13695, partial [Acidobacteria bacterium]
MTKRGATSSYFVLFLLLLVLAQGAYVGIGLYLTPTVANVLPNPARAGGVITIHGSNFAADAWDNAVLFGNQSGKVTRTTASTIEVELPPGGSAGTTHAVVRVVVGGRVSAPFEITIAPSVAAVSSPEPPPPTPTTIPTPAPASPPRSTPPPTPRPAPSATPASPRVADLLAEAATA